jgi:hypothetical protein
MSRLHLAAVVPLLLLLSLSRTAWAQDNETAFRAEFAKGYDIGDERSMDKATKKAAIWALAFYEELYLGKQEGKEEAALRLLALQASWQRCFESTEPLEKLDRWLSGADSRQLEQLRKSRSDSNKLWGVYSQIVKTGKKADFEQLVQQFSDLARTAETFGHSIQLADLWSSASVVASKMPDKTVADRAAVVTAIEQFLAARKAWGFTFDEHYMRNHDFAKSEKAKVEAAQQAEQKRKAEGYDVNAKGVESLVMPGVAEQKHALKFEALATWEELDYGPKTGPVPVFWWMTSMEKEGSARKLDWFRRADVHVIRTGAAKFVVSMSPSDPKGGVEVDANSKGKVASFFLDVGKTQQYAMVFWAGSDREMINETEGNFAPSDTLMNVYYRSAASWKAQVGAETVVLYDDGANGLPGDAQPLELGYRAYTLGVPDTGTPAPLLDSMRIGKGPRVPYSEFVKLAGGWFHMKKGAGDDIALRPLNPEYVKPAKLKLVWNGPKPTAPVQLVIQGVGEYQTAFFDVAGGKEIELPAAEYKVIWGRLQQGKGTRSQLASIYQGNSKTFVVEPGKLFELKMGAPFALQFERRGDENASIDATKILLTEASGCVFTEYHGINIACEVLAAKEADGKGAKPVGRFVRFSDWDLVNAATKSLRELGLLIACFPMPEGYRTGEPSLSIKLPAQGMKLGLTIKKHPWFGVVNPAWQ